MATAAYTTVVDRAVDDPITEAIWDDQIKDNGNMLQGKGSGNWLVNGGFEVWQRGTGSFTANSAYSADRWYLYTTSGTLTVTRESSTIEANSRYSLKAVTTGAGATEHAIIQNIENGYALRGQTYSFSVRVNQSVASGVTISIDGQTSSTTSATTGSWVTLTATGVVGSSATSVNVIIYFAAAGTYYLDNAMWTLSPSPMPFEPLHPQAELARCQRYYEFIGGAAVSIYMSAYHTAGSGIGFTLPYKVSKGGTPTVTKVGTWTVTNCGQPTVNNPSSESCNLQATVTATGGANFYTSNATDGITVEWP